MKSNSAFTTIVKTQPLQSVNQHDSQPFQETAAGAGTLALALFGATAVSMISVWWVKTFSKNLREKGIIHASSRIPCSNCQFFSKNSYLRCAVHPTIAMTPEAKDCVDYSATQENP